MNTGCSRVLAYIYGVVGKAIGHDTYLECSVDTIPAKELLRLYRKTMRLKLRRLPLHIHDKDPLVRALVRYRLRRGR